MVLLLVKQVILLVSFSNFVSLSMSSPNLIPQQHFSIMGTASNIAPALRRSSSANMATMKSSAVVVRQSATSLMITKTTAKIEQDNYWRKIKKYAITNFPQLMNAEERLEDRQNNLFQGILIGNQRVGNPPCREVVNEKGCTVNARLVGPSRLNTSNRTPADPVLILANPRAKSIAPDVTVITRTRSSYNTRATSTRAKPGSAHSSSSLVSQAKSRAAVRALVSPANALSQCRDCSVVVTRIDTTFGFKSSAPSVTLTSPLKSAARATSRAKSTTSNLTRISSAVVPRLVSPTKSGAGVVSTNALSGSVVRAASQITESETVGCLNTKPFAKTRAAVRAAALSTATASQCRDCRVVLRRIDATSELKSAATIVTTTTHLGSASCAKSRAKSDGLDVAVTSLTSSSNTRVKSRAKTSTTYSTSLTKPKTRAAVRKTAFSASAMTLSQCRDRSAVVTRVRTAQSK